VDFLYSGTFVRALSTGVVTLCQHLRHAQHHLLQPVLGLCSNALGLSNEIRAHRNHHRRHAPRRLEDVATIYLELSVLDGETRILILGATPAETIVRQKHSDSAR
jgi:hypothetical protein